MVAQKAKPKINRIEFDEQGFIKSGTMAEKSKLKSLQNDITKRDIMFIKSVGNPIAKNNQSFVKSAHIGVNLLYKNDVMADDTFDQISRMSSIYHNLLLDTCNRDYYNNVNPKSVVTVLGPYESMAMLSSSVQRTFDEDSYVHTKLKSEIDNLSFSDMNHEYQSIRYNALNNNSMYLTADSAALIYLAWSKQACDELYKTDDDENAVRDIYNDKIIALKYLCDEYRIPSEELYGTIRAKVSEITNEDSQLIVDMKPVLDDTIYKDMSPRDIEFKSKQSNVWQAWYDIINMSDKNDSEPSVGDEYKQADEQKKAESKTESKKKTEQKAKEPEQTAERQTEGTEEPKKTEQVQQNAQKSQRKRTLKEKPVYVISGSAEEAQYLKQLKDDITGADISFMDYNANLSDISSNDYDSQMSRMNQMYYRMMLSQCVRPLMYGINPDSIIQTVGTFAGMALMNKGFRQACHTEVQQRLYPAMNKLPMSYQQKMLFNDELPIGLDSAAMMHLSWSKQAYDKMREPGADVNSIMDDYARATDALKARCERCGISEDDLNQNIRLKVGQLAQKNPEVLTLFTETAYQQVTMADFQQDGETSVWTGEFIDTTGILNCDSNGNPQPGTFYTGSFTPRPPLSMDDMINGYQAVLSEMETCNTVDELDKFLTHHDADADLYLTMMVSDGCDYDEVVQSMGDANKTAMKRWINNHSDEYDNLKVWAHKFAEKTDAQNKARQKAGVANRKIPTKFEEILQDSGEHYNYSMDKM